MAIVQDRPALTPEEVAAFCEDHTNAEAARHFGINERTVRKLKARARGRTRPAPAPATPRPAPPPPPPAPAPVRTPRFYVYVLSWPNGQPFYVGKGQGRRMFDHDNEALSGCVCQKCDNIRTIWRMGGQVVRYVVFATHSEAEAFAYERELISLYGRATLTNRIGGDA